MGRVQLVEDERSMRDLLALMLRKEGHEVEAADTAIQGRSRLETAGPFDLLISDISMPGMSGLDLLRQSRRICPETAVVLMTAFGTKQTAIEALNDGASYYVEKPFDLDEIKTVVKKTLEQKRLQAENAHLRTQNKDLKAELKIKYEFAGLVGRSPKMQAIFELIKRVAGTGSTIMVSGESGTGKELIARAVHYNSGRGDGEFVSINCGALPDELLESELFGHMRGSFTGAIGNKKGLFEVANGGTIFLDEIGETTPAMQIKLLRVLQERRIRRVGGTEEIPVDVRVITATNQDLERMVQDRRFREDLFYRINVIAIRMPPLREKPEDIPALARHFLEKYRAMVGKPIRGISQAAMEFLESYGWPGNVRQLENVMERAVALESTEEIGAESLPPEVRQGSERRGRVEVALPESGINLEDWLEKSRMHYMTEGLDRCGGVQTRAAELLGMTFRSFRYFAKKYGLNPKDILAEEGVTESEEEEAAAGHSR